MNIQGKVAWVTGASSGIGEALANELFAEGASIILSARSEEKLVKMKAGFDRIDKDRSFVVPCDITLPESIEQAMELAKKKAGRIDILINNAGVSQRALALETSLKTDRELFEVNYFGAVTLTKGILPWMISGGGGHVVVISSMAGKFGFPLRSTYSASKHALHGFFETLRSELVEKNVRVTLVCPGRIKTDISVHSLTGEGKLYGKMDKGQERGVAVEKCARIIARAIKHDRKEVFVGKSELLLLSVKRVCAPLFYWIVNRTSPV